LVRRRVVVEARPKPRLRQVDRLRVIPPASIDELVGPDHPVRVIWDYVSTLDLTPLLVTIKAVEGVPGRNATDPRILLAVWMWAVCDGIGTARAVEALCREQAAYRWLAGGVSLNHHLLSTFRSSHEAALDRFLEAHVSALLQQGLIELACVAQDGMRMRASAGTGSFRRAASIEEWQELVRQQIEQLKRQEGEPLDAVSRRQRSAQERHMRERLERLAAARQAAEELGAKQSERVRLHPKEAEERKTKDKPARGSTTDPESRRMKMPDGGTRPGYNVQCVTTVDTGIIVGVAVTNQGSDGGLLGPMLDQLEQSYRKQPSQVLVDGGYGSRDDVEAAFGRNIAVYTPLKNEREELATGKNPYAPKSGDKAGMKALRMRMETPEAKHLYRKPAATAEWVNAGMRQRGLYRFTVGGRVKVRVVVLHALVHNLWQTIRLVKAKQPASSWQGILRAAFR
jgi:transposase